MMKNLVRNLRNLRTAVKSFPPGDEAARAASYPPPYPDGWYKLADAADLARGDVRCVDCLGQRLVLFRSDTSDELGLLDANCPHQGANLAGGAVHDGCLQCPFHHWCVAADGRVAAIPYSAQRPASLRTRSWPVREYHGMVVMYYSAQRAAGIEQPPPYELDLLGPLLSPSMVFRGALDHPGPVRMHLIEFAENSADFQHFTPLHGRMHVPWTKWLVPFVTVSHSPTWEIDAQRAHVCYFYNDAVLQLRGRRMPSTRARASITFLGPGGLTVFQISIPKLGSVVLFHTHTPTAPLEQTVQFRWYADKRLPRLLVSYVVGSWIAQWRNDIAIWESKHFQQRPMLVPGDGPVLRMRRWYKQFYPAAENVELQPRAAVQPI
jgi:cholesterol 7-dehydrogenase